VQYITVDSKLWIITMSRLNILDVVLWLLVVALFVVRDGVNGDNDKNAFTYFEKDSDLGRGVGNWDEVSSDYQYFPWEGSTTSSNRCKDRRSSFRSHRQSPIAIKSKNANDCESADNDDNHRHWTAPGTCTLNDVTWTIEPWGLLMAFPQSSTGRSCHPPIMDSSGGYGDAFIANYVSVVSPSEHYLDGEQFDAEINIAHFSSVHGSKIPMIFSVLARADASYPDNPILEPYLREWDRIHAQHREKCETSKVSSQSRHGRELKHCPVTTANQLSTGGQFTQTTGKKRDSSGIMFDMMAGNNVDVAIKAFDLNIWSKGEHSHTFRVFVRDNQKGQKGTHVGYETSSSAWSEISSSRNAIHLYGMGENKPSRLTLDIPFLLKKGQGKLGFYIFFDNDNDLLNADVNNKRTGQMQASSDGDELILFVGTVVGDDSGDYGPFQGRTYSNRGFAGNVYYNKCDLAIAGGTAGSGEYSMISAQNGQNNSKAGLELPQSISKLSGDGVSKDFIHTHQLPPCSSFRTSSLFVSISAVLSFYNILL
jgi:hypothetical protein